MVSQNELNILIFMKRLLSLASHTLPKQTLSRANRSSSLGHCEAVDADLVRRHLAAIGLPTNPAHALGNIWSGDALIGHMAKDKKVADGKLTFILARAIGDAFITQEVTREDLTTLFEGAMTS